MSPYRALIYFILLNGMFSMFTTIGVYSMAATSGVGGWNVGFSLISTSTGILFTGGLLGGAAVAYLSGISPLTGAAFGTVTGLFFDMFVKMFAVLNNISASLKDYSGIANGFIMMITAVFIISFIWMLVQMAVGGTATHER